MSSSKRLTKRASVQATGSTYFLELSLLLPVLLVTLISPTASWRWRLSFLAGGLWVTAVLFRSLATAQARVPFRYLLLVAWGVLQFVSSDIADLGACAVWVSTVLLQLLPIFVFDAYLHRNRILGVERAMVWTLLPIVSYLLVVNVIFLAAHPMAARYLSSYRPGSVGWSSVDYQLPVAMGGGFPFIYALIPLAASCAYYAASRGLRLQARLGLAITTLCLFGGLYLANLTTAFLVGLAVVPIAYVLGVGTGFGRCAQVLRFGLVSVLVLLGAFAVVIDWQSMAVHVAGQFDPQSVFGQRLTELANFSPGSGASSSVSARYDNATRSLESFLQSPWIGRLSEGGFQYADEVMYVGQHSEWLDTLARYGMLGSVMLVGFICASLKALFESVNAKSRSLVGLLSAVLGVLGMLNPVLNTAVLWVIFVLVPSLRVEERGLVS